MNEYWNEEAWQQFAALNPDQQWQREATHTRERTGLDATREAFERFAATPAGQKALQALGILGQGFEAWEQVYMRDLASMGSLVRGDFQNALRLKAGGEYRPGDLTGRPGWDWPATVLGDPANWIPGGVPAKAAGGAAVAAAAKAAAGGAADVLPQVGAVFAGGKTLRGVMGEANPPAIPASARVATNLGEDIVPGAPMHTFRTEVDEAAFRAQQAQKPAGARIFSEPLEEAQVLADAYKRDFQGMGYNVDEFNPGIVTKLDVDHQKLIADAFDAAEHMPFNPDVQAAYKAMASETLDQYKTISDSGIRFEIWDKGGEPYKNSAEMLSDVRNNKRMYILSTEGDFGQTAITDAMRAENPLLQYSGYADVNGKPLLINDVFRGVHDFFGHGVRGNSFGAVGEENAWIEHALMYSPLARRAMTTETRGQNSWVNFGPHMRNADGTIKKPGDEGYLDARSRPFSEQKITLLPEWASNALLGEAVEPSQAINAINDLDGLLSTVGERLSRNELPQRANLEIIPPGARGTAQEVQGALTFDDIMQPLVNNAERYNRQVGLSGYAGDFISAEDLMAQKQDLQKYIMDNLKRFIDNPPSEYQAFDMFSSLAPNLITETEDALEILRSLRYLRAAQ